MFDTIVRGSSGYGFTDIDICPSFLQWHKLARLYCSHGIKFIADMNQSTSIAISQIYIWNKMIQVSSWSQVDQICKCLNLNSLSYLMQISGRLDLFEVLLTSLNHCWGILTTEFNKWEALSRVAWSDVSKNHSSEMLILLMHRRAEKGRERNGACWSCKL